MCAFTCYSVHLFDLDTCKKQKTLHSKQTGISQLRFTQAPLCVLIATLHTPLELFLWNLKTNEFLNSFRLQSEFGSNLRIDSLQVSTICDTFCVLGSDGHVRILDAAKGGSSADLLFNYSAIDSKGNCTLN